MALPIKDTPVLKGKDAKRFFLKMAENKKVSKEEYERMKSNSNKLKEISRF
ncbi:MAG: hypothetical protein IIA88_00975 [Bacteroidetes bacterium]|nr:hypothetical protein [Bacteroidota bacterium]